MNIAYHPLTFSCQPAKSTGLDYMRAACQSCEGGQDDGTLPCPSTTTSFRVISNL